MKRILSFLLLVAALVIAASYTAPRPSIESIEFPPGPPTDAEISQLLSQLPTATLTVWPVATEVHAVTVDVHTATAWSVTTGTPQLLEAWQSLDVTAWSSSQPVYTVTIWPGPEPVHYYALTTCPTMEPVMLDVGPE